MKLNYTVDGLEDLTNYMYDYKSDLFVHNGEVYKFVPECSFCTHSFMGELSSSYLFCDRDCRGAYIFNHCSIYLL